MWGAPSAENGSAASARMQPKTFIKSMEAPRSYTQRTATREITMKCLRWLWLCTLVACPSHKGSPDGGRSEEHTSELQSHLNLVCRLLLEKKKTTNVTASQTA